MRLIDADKLCRGLDLLMQYFGCGDEKYGVERAKQMVKIEPTVDAKPIVYCKDCKHTTGSKLKCSKFNEIQMTGLHFCSYGKRKGEGE